jgi:hypothetical protein
MQNRSHWMKFFKVFGLSYVVMSLTPHEGNVVQRQPFPEATLRDFFIKYGPSARECYNSAASVGHFTSYIEKLSQAIARLTWNDIDNLVTHTIFIVKLDDKTSDLVLIRPADEQRMTCFATVITRTVMRLIWKAHGHRLKRKANELFHVHETHQVSSFDAEWLFEAMVHDLLEDGIDVPMDPMVFEENRHADAVNDKYLTSTIGTGRWISNPMVYVPFTQYDRALELESFHYYVPMDASNPTYDSFTFEFVPISSYKGPILKISNDKTLYDKSVLNAVRINFSLLLIYMLKAPHPITQNSNIGLSGFTVFQATKAPEQDINEASLLYLFAIADHCQLNAIGIRYIGILPTGERPTFRLPTAWRGKLDLYTVT